MSRAAFVVKSPRAAALRAINYSQDVELLSRSRKNQFRSVPLHTLLANLGSSYWSVFTRIDCAPEHGVELLTQVDMFAAEPLGRIIRIDSMPRPENHEIKRWQVLIAGAGQMSEGNLFARSIIADDRIAGKYLGPHAVSLDFEDRGGSINLWTYAFLNTMIGIRAVKSCAFGTSVPGLRLDLIKDLPIPIPEDPDIERRVASLVRTCVEQREVYWRELQAARRVLEELPEMREAHAMCSERQRRIVTWRGPLTTLRAWNWASAGEALMYLRSFWGQRLNDCLHEGYGIFKGDRMVRTPCEAPHGVDLLSQRDIFSIRPVPRRILLLSDTERDVSPNTILVASRGQMNEGALFGAVERAAHMPKGAIVTEDITRLEPSNGMSEMLYAFLSTKIGKRLLQTTAYGTSIPGMRIDLLSDLPVPMLSFQNMQDVTTHIAKATQARVNSANAESEAIRILEEEVLPAWLR